MPYIDFKTLLTGALAFTMALAWNDGVSSSIRSLYPSDRRGSAHATITYAIVITILVIIIVVAINHIGHATSKLSAHFKGAPSWLSGSPTTTPGAHISPIIRW